MSDQDIVDKFNRACDYKKMNASQKAQAHAQWSNLMSVKDIGEAMRTLAKFGQPATL